jgi:hypothetical protein
VSAQNIERLFPRLRSTGYAITSPFDENYNCIAYADEDPWRRWWWPAESTDAYWPADVPREPTLAAFQQAFRTLGYEVCESANAEVGFQKIAIYADRTGQPTHAARQLPDGAWTSKLGNLEDIRHPALRDLEDAIPGVALYGNVAIIMRRPSV